MIITNRKKDEDIDRTIKTMMVEALDGIEVSGDFKNRIIKRIAEETSSPSHKDEKHKD